MLIRPATPIDCAPVAQLHQRCLDQSFLGTLGEGFLRLVYRFLADYEQGMVLVAVYEAFQGREVAQMMYSRKNTNLFSTEISRLMAEGVQR